MSEQQTREHDPAARLRELAKGWVENDKSYRRRYRPDVVAGLHVGVRELFIEAETAQRLLDIVRVLDGYPQGDGDIDARVARAVHRLIQAEGSLASISRAHARETADGGMVGDYCIECERRWPCPTRQWADGERDVNDAWDGDSDGEA